MQAPDHANRQAALAVQDLRNARSRSDERFQVLAREPLLFHGELDRLDRIRRLHRVMLGLVGIDKRCQHIETVALRRAAFRAPKTLNLVEGFLVVRLRANWLQLIRSASPDRPPWPGTLAC
jgi:hypothetical protein